MNYNDWSELHVQLQPLSRKLYEAMARREWSDAELLASELCTIALSIQRNCIKNNVIAQVSDPAPSRIANGYMYEA